MRTTVIWLDQYDDVTSACDKMDWCKTGRIVLVMPGRTQDSFRRTIDYLLLLRHSQKLGAQLAIVSQLERVYTYAAESGIPVFDSTEEAQKRPWRRPSRPHWTNESTKKLIVSTYQHKSSQTVRGKNWFRLVWRGCLIIGILFCLLMVNFFLTTARIYVSPTRVVQKTEFSIMADSSLSTMENGNSIPLFTKTFDYAGIEEADSTGTILIPDQFAKGVVKFQNLNNSAVDVPVNTVVVMSGPLSVRYLTDFAIIVPASGDKSATVSVRASQPGAKGNAEAGVVRGLEGVLGAKLIVSNPLAITGGTDLLTKSPSEADYSALRARLLDRLLDSAKTEILATAMVEDFFLESSLRLQSSPKETIVFPVGTPSNTAKLSMQVFINVDFMKRIDLDRFASVSLGKQFGEGVISDTTWQITASRVVDDKKTWLILTAQRQAVPKLDKARIARLAYGKSVLNAQKAISAEYNLDRPVDIQIQSPWWNWVPLWVDVSVP